MINKHCLKTILTTASTLAITVAASESIAAQPASMRTITSSPAHTSNTANFGGTFNDGDSILFGDAANSAVFDSPISVSGINMAGLNPSGSLVATASGASTGSIGNGAGSMPLVINDGVSFSFSGTQPVDMSVPVDSYALSSITLGSSVDGAPGTTLTINGAGGGTPTFYTNINSYPEAAGNRGTLAVNATYLFSNVIGGISPLAAINVGNDANFGFMNVTADAVNLTTANAAVVPWIGVLHGNIFNTSGTVGNTAVLLTFNGPSTIFGSIGTTAAPLSKVNIPNNHSLEIDASAAPRNIYAPLTTDGNHTGTFIVNGGTVTLHQNVGTNIAALSQITVNNDATLSLDSSAHAIDVYAPIDSYADNQGNLLLTAAGTQNDITLHDNIGSNHRFNNITMNVPAGRTMTFEGNVTALNDIDASGAGSTVTFEGNVTSLIENFLTSTSNFNSVTGNIELGGNMTLNGDTSVAGNVSATDGININGHSLTETGASTITGDIHTTGNAGTGGSFIINGNDVTLAGSAGASGHTLTQIELSSYNTLTIDSADAARNIYAPIINGTGHDGQGTVVVAGGTNSVTFHGAIATGPAALHNITINANSTAIIDSAVTAVHSSIDGASAGAGILKTSGAANLEFVNAVGTTFHSLASIDTTLSTAGTITFDGAVSATNITTGAAAVTFGGAVTGSITTGAGNVRFNNAAIPAAVALGNAASQVTFAAGGVYTGAITNSTGSAGNGTIGIISNNLTFGNGTTIGAAGTGMMHSILLEDNHNLTLQGATIYAPIETSTNGIGSLNISSHNSTLYGSVGTSIRALNAINFSTAQTLALNSSAGNMDIYAPITTTAGDYSGTISIPGTNSVTFHGQIGTGVAHISGINVATGATATFDSAVGNVYSNVDGTWYDPGSGVAGSGTLRTTGNGSLTFQRNVGDNQYFGLVDTTASTLNMGGTNVITFNGYLNATTIRVGAVPVVGGWMLGNAELTNVASTITLGQNLYSRTITNTTGTPNSGTVILNGAFVVNSNWGLPGNGTLNQVSIIDGSNINFQGGTIYAPITASTNNTATLTINNGTPTIYGNIGAENKVFQLVTVTDASTLTTQGSIWATNISLRNNAATLASIGGTLFASNHIHAPINGSNVGTGQGIINVGVEGIAGTTQFHNTMGSTCPIKLLTVADSATPWVFNTNSTAMILANASFDGRAGGPAGIRIGDGAQFIANGGGLALTNGATIEGTGANRGTLVLASGQALPCTAGSNDAPLQSVVFYTFNNGGAAGSATNDVNALNVDLQAGSRILLDSHVSSTHVKGSRTVNGVALTTGITSSDSSGTAAVNGVYPAGYAEFRNNVGTTIVGNVGVPTMITGTGVLSIAGAMPDNNLITLNGYTNDTTVTFFADGGTLSIQDGGSIMSVASHGGSYGRVTNEGDVTFLNSIGAHGAGIHTFDVGSGGNINFPNSIAVYASNSNLGNGTYNINNQTVTLSGGTAVLNGDIVINANYTGNNQIVLDLSGTSGVTDNTTSITLHIASHNATPVLGTSVIKMIHLPSGRLSRLPTVTSFDGKWIAVYNSGEIHYGALPVSLPPIQTSNTVFNTSDFSPQGASRVQIASALSDAHLTNASPSEIMMSNNLFSKVIISPQVQPSQSIVQIINGSLGALGTAVTANPTAHLSKSNIINIAQSMQYTGTMNDDNLFMAITHGESVGVSPEASEEMAKIAVAGGAAATQQISHSVSTEILNATAGRISSLTQNTIPLTFTFTGGALKASNTQLNLLPTTNSIRPASSPVTQAPARPESANIQNTSPAISRIGEEATEVSGLDLEAAAGGVAAGSSAYEKFGVWGMINGGFAHQKMLKGTSGFKSVSKGATLGVDTMISDRSIIGYSISHAVNDVKLKDLHPHDKTHSSSWIGTIYGNHQLKNNWFIRGSALFNRTNINSKSLRPGIISPAVAQAKYNAISYGGEASVGFAHLFKNGIIATPSIGMRVIHNNKISYKETGNTVLKNSMSQNAIDNYSALFGLSVSKGFSKYNIDFTPEAHVNMQYGVNTKTPQGTFISPLTPNQVTSFVGQKASKFSSSYGASLTASGDRIECSVSTDVTIAQKYVGYQGSLKLKVKF